MGPKADQGFGILAPHGQVIQCHLDWRCTLETQKRKGVAIMFLLVAMLSLTAAVLPLIKGGDVNATLLGSAVIWLAISVAVGRGSNADAKAPPT